MWFFLALRDGHRDIFAALFDAQAFRPGNIGLDLKSAGVFAFAILEGSQAIAMHDSVGIGRIRLEALAHEQARFPMRVAARFGEGNVRRQGHIARNFFQTKWNASLVNHMFLPPPALDGVDAMRGVY